MNGFLIIHGMHAWETVHTHSIGGQIIDRERREVGANKEIHPNTLGEAQNTRRYAWFLGVHRTNMAAVEVRAVLSLFMDRGIIF